MADKFRYWSMIVYPESAPRDWIQVLSDTGLPSAISPVHNKDLDIDGHFKKEHYHCIVCFSGPTTYNNVLHIASLCGTEVIKNIYSVKGSFDYLSHKNDPDKAQYDENDIKLLNGFCIDNYCQLSPMELQRIISDIDDDILLYGVSEYAALRLLYKYTDMQKYKFVNSHSMLYKSVFSSIRGGGGLSHIEEQVAKIIDERKLKIINCDVQEFENDC